MKELVFLTGVTASFLITLIGCGGDSTMSSEITGHALFYNLGTRISNDRLVDLIGKNLKDNAFSIDVPFEHAPWILEKYKPELRLLEIEDFRTRMTGILRSEFKIPGTNRNISHLSLLSSKRFKSETQDSSIQSSLEWRDGIPILKIYKFSPGSYAQDKMMQYMQAISSSNRLVVDLRDNPGGVVAWVQDFVSYFIPSHISYSYEIKKEHYLEYKRVFGLSNYDANSMLNFVRNCFDVCSQYSQPEYQRVLFNGHLVVLLNRNSASGAEVIAAALRDLRGAEIIGETTQGETLSSIIFNLTSELSLQLPFAEVITPSGERIEGNGIRPTRPEFNVGSEMALERAIQHLSILRS